MIINSIEIENFRSFYGPPVRIDLRPKNGKNTTLVYAQNGVGKTNFMNAFLWGFHGITNGLTITRDEGLINADAKREGRKDYHVIIEFEHEGKEFRLHRTGNDKSDKTKVKIWHIDEGNNKQIRMSASLFINSILPKDMASYFINAGESENLEFNPDGTITITKSVEDILGHGLAKEAIVDLKTIAREYRKHLAKNSGADIAELDEKMRIAEESEAEWSKKQNEYKVLIEEYDKKIQIKAAQLSKSDSELVKREHRLREEAGKNLEQAKSRVDRLHNEKAAVIKGYYATAFGNALVPSLKALFKERKESGQGIPSPWNEKLIDDILSNKACICGAEIKKGTEAFKAIEAMRTKAVNPDVSSRHENAHAQLVSMERNNEDARDRVKALRNDLIEATNQIREYQDKIEEATLNITSQDDLQDVLKLEKERNTILAQRDQAIRDEVRAKDNKVRAQGKLADYQKELDAFKLKQPSLKRQTAEHSDIEQITQIIQKELDDDVKNYPETLENKMNEFLKKYLIQDYLASLDVDTMKVGLDNEGRMVGISGGQQQLLRLIYVSSLIDIARSRTSSGNSILTGGAVAPLIVDAPFAKLMPAYRTNVAAHMPSLVDQLILISYKEEDGTDEILRKSNKLNQIYYFKREQKGSGKGKVKADPIIIEGEEHPSVEYGKPINKIVVLREDVANG